MDVVLIHVYVRNTNNRHDVELAPDGRVGTVTARTLMQHLVSQHSFFKKLNRREDDMIYELYRTTPVTSTRVQMVGEPLLADDTISTRESVIIWRRLPKMPSLEATTNTQ